ncbi:hypothetical protein [Paenarthrobacter nitroguajacolicus]|uniref:hypothetical protein n=1 Tax=Paenarthrobacter nitroguajacolicus TaxID=211146 RepID=UPI00248BACCC|nr:hypothetical protein [Paenarthrobacter nitroguajacolicus]MDI2034795.1 hypothetical protein [Paenarthrobacter nitroguajacolicus]
MSGITLAAEQFASADPEAEKGVAEAVRRCMATAGYDYTPVSSGQESVDLKNFIGFDSLTVETARTFGYASSKPKGPGEPAPDSTLGKLMADPGFQQALNGGGSPEQNVVRSSAGTGMLWGGCNAEGITAIYGNADKYMRATGLALNSLMVATNAAGQDAGVQSAVESWKECMSTTAFPYSHPGEAVSAGHEAGGQKELKIAVTDATCRESTGFDAKITTVLDKYLTTRMKELEAEVADVKQIRHEASERAQLLLG